MNLEIPNHCLFNKLNFFTKFSLEIFFACKNFKRDFNEGVEYLLFNIHQRKNTESTNFAPHIDLVGLLSSILHI